MLHYGEHRSLCTTGNASSLYLLSDSRGLLWLGVKIQVCKALLRLAPQRCIHKDPYKPAAAPEIVFDFQMCHVWGLQVGLRRSKFVYSVK